MDAYTCTLGQGQQPHRAQAGTILTPSGERFAIICPTHGVTAWRGFKSAGGVAATRSPNGTDPNTLEPGAITKMGNRFVIRPPRGTWLLVQMPVAEPEAGVVTVDGFIDTAAWRGWLEGSIWLEEE